MTKLSLIFTTLVLSLIQSTNNEHIGRWEGRDKGEVGFLIFDTKGYATIQAMGKTMGGEEFLIGNNAAYMTFEIDYETTPYTVDFIIQQISDDAELARLKGIFEYLDKNTLKLALGFDGSRPSEFGEDTDVVFERVN